MVEYIADAEECDQKPYDERDKATSPESKVGEQIIVVKESILWLGFKRPSTYWG